MTTHTTTYNGRLLTDLWRIRGLWFLALVCAVLTLLYLVNSLREYQNSGTLEVSARWNYEHTELILTPISPEALALIQPGDHLLAINGQPLARPIAYNRADFPIFYGALGSTLTATLRTGDEAPRTIPIPLNQITHPILRDLVAHGIAVEPLKWVWVALEIIWILIIWGVAFVLVLRSPRERLAWITSAVLLLLGPRTTVMEYLRFFPAYQQVFLTYAGAYSMGIALMYYFPDGKWYPRFTLWLWFAYGLFNLNRFVNLIEPVNRVYLLVDFLFMLSIFFTQIYRYRHYYTELHRQQVRWVLAGMMLCFAGFYLVTLYISLLQGQFGSIYAVGPILRICILVAIGGLTMGLLRLRLYDADYALNRSLVFSGITFALATCFLVLVALLRLVLPNNELSTIILVLAGVAVGLLFQPLRYRIQHLVDRRFFRLRLDLNEIADLERKRRQSLQGNLSSLAIPTLQLESVIGRGGMGEVYRAKRDTQSVAVKVLLPKSAQDPKDIARFEREIEIMHKLHHPNIVHLLDAGYVNDLRYVVMEYIAGQSLAEYLEQRERLPLDQTRRILRDVAKALDYIHGLGIVHRDIKPGNILLQEMRAVLMDFSIARLTDSTTQITQEGVMGTLDYIAPEQIRTASTVDQRADVYALGAMAYHMLSGEPPFKGGVGQVIFAHLQQPPPNICEHYPDIPPTVGLALLRAMSKDPETRYPVASEFVAALG